jgi:hypothetical protein
VGDMRILGLVESVSNNFPQKRKINIETSQITTLGKIPPQKSSSEHSLKVFIHFETITLGCKLAL